MRPHPYLPQFARHASGFSLIELMIGILVGLIVALAVIQSLSLFDSQKSTTTSTSEAQENGLVSLALLEQDIHNAGVGLADKTPFDCTNYYTFYDDGTTSGAILKPDGVSPFDVTPVRITDGGSGSDTITIQYGSNFLGTLPAFLTATATAAENPYLASRVWGYSAGDMLLAVEGTQCTLVRVSGTDTTLSNIQHAAATAPNYNPSPAPVSWPLYTANTKLFDLGQFVTNQYTVNGGNLVVAQQILGPVPRVSTSTVLASNIVNLQAQYGVTVASPATITQATTVAQWVDATGTWDAAAMTPTNAKRIIAIRLSVVARSIKKEAGTVTNACTTGSGVVNVGPCAWTSDSGTGTSPAPMIDLTNGGTTASDWQQYRYKVYQTIIPLRNVIWTFSQ